MARPWYRYELRDLAGQSVVSTLTLNVVPVQRCAATDCGSCLAVTMAEDETPRDILLSPTFFFDPDLNNGDTLTLTHSLQHQRVAGDSDGDWSRNSFDTVA